MYTCNTYMYTSTYLNIICIFDMSRINISFICDYDHDIAIQCETHVVYTEVAQRRKEFNKFP